MTQPRGPFLEIEPPLGPPDAVLIASPSKSATHRAILMGARTPHTVLDNPLISADTAASLRVAIALGARVSAEPVTDAGQRMLARVGTGPQPMEAKDAAASQSSGLATEWTGLDLGPVLGNDPQQVARPLLAASVRLHIEGGAPSPSDHTTIDLANSGTTLRIATAIASTLNRRITLCGDTSLHTRPMGPLAQALASLGADVVCEGPDGRPPVATRGPWTATHTTVPGNVSSQFISALLIAAQGGPGLTLEVTSPLKSAPYVDVTRRIVERFGGTIETTEPLSDGTGPTYTVPPNTALRATRMFVPGDYSSAAFPLVGAAITGGRVALAGLDPASEQGDRAIINVLGAAGCEIQWSDDAERPDTQILTCTAPAGPPLAFEHAFTQTPDLFPALAALAARAHGTSRLTDAAHVRLKECDRVAAMARALSLLGIDVDERDDALIVVGSPGDAVPAAALDAHDDHRILMALTMLGLAGPGPLYITDPGCYHVSYPRFRLDVDTLGGATRVLEHEEAMTRIQRATPSMPNPSEAGP